jgi:hypothetical protein
MSDGRRCARLDGPEPDERRSGDVAVARRVRAAAVDHSALRTSSWFLKNNRFFISASLTAF